jgi:hypothetical protein
VSVDHKAIKKIVASITKRWRRDTEDIFEIGHKLAEAETDLGKDYKKLFGTGRLPFSEKVATKLKLIAANPVLGAHMHQCPPGWSTLYELTKIKDAKLEAAFDCGDITPSTTFVVAQNWRIEAEADEPADLRGRCWRLTLTV